MQTRGSVAPSLSAVRGHRAEILRLAAAHGVDSVRIFGSVARGDAGPTSDVDLLVDVVSPAEGLAYFGLLEDFRRAVSSVLGCDVDVVDSAALRQMRDPVLSDAVPL